VRPGSTDSSTLGGQAVGGQSTVDPADSDDDEVWRHVVRVSAQRGCGNAIPGPRFVVRWWPV
jgi:hypothetical protein